MNTQLPPRHKAAIQELGIINPENVPTKQASAYLTKLVGVPVAPSSLEVYRSTSRGPKYKKIGSRCFYSLTWLDEWAAGVEIKIYDPSRCREVAA
jgi:hypothetical protein